MYGLLYSNKLDMTDPKKQSIKLTVIFLVDEFKKRKDRTVCQTHLGLVIAIIFRFRFNFLFQEKIRSDLPMLSPGR